MQDLFRAANKQDSIIRKGTVEILIYLIFRLVREINDDIPADDHMDMLEIPVLEQIVLLEFHAFLDFRADCIMTVIHLLEMLV